MTEKRPGYATGAGKPPSAAEFRRRPCCRPYSAPNFEPPSAEDFRDLVALTGWSQGTLAHLVGVGYSEKNGSTTIRKWKTPAGGKEARGIPYAAWRLLLVAAGLATIDDDREAVGIE